MASFALDKYVIDDSESTLEGSIHYSIIGRYECVFNNFTGSLIFDPDDLAHSAIDFTIQTQSFSSTHGKLDNLAKSPRFLHSAKFPEATFKSKRIEKEEGKNEYRVTADVTLKDITKELTFSVKIEGPFTDKRGSYLKTTGTCLVNRKAFDIIWSKWLDIGGIILGNHITLTWDLTARKVAANANMLRN